MDERRHYDTLGFRYLAAVAVATPRNLYFCAIRRFVVLSTPNTLPVLTVVMVALTSNDLSGQSIN